MPSRPRKPSPGRDDAFAAEMAQLAEDRRQAHIGTFHEEWQDRLSRPLAPLYETTLHTHSEACLGEPHQAQVSGGTYVWVRRCSVSRTSVEVERP